MKNSLACRNWHDNISIKSNEEFAHWHQNPQVASISKLYAFGDRRARTDPIGISTDLYIKYRSYRNKHRWKIFVWRRYWQINELVFPAGKSEIIRLCFQNPLNRWTYLFMIYILTFKRNSLVWLKDVKGWRPDTWWNEHKIFLIFSFLFFGWWVSQNNHCVISLSHFCF